MPPLIPREDSPRPVVPVPMVQSTCSGWSCLNDAEQFGVLFSVVVTVTILGVIFICFMKSRRAERDYGVELFHVGLPRELRRRYAGPVPVMLPPPPAYQAVQAPYGQYAQPGMHVQAPPGATVQPYVAGPGTFTPVGYGATDGHRLPTPLNGPAPNGTYLVPEQPVSQVPAGAVPLYQPQPGAYGQGSVPGPWHTPNVSHMSAVPQFADPSKPTLRQRLMHMFRLPMGHASTITGSPPSPRNVSRAASPHPASISRRNSPARPSTRQPVRGARAGYRRSARTSEAPTEVTITVHISQNSATSILAGRVFEHKQYTELEQRFRKLYRGGHTGPIPRLGPDLEESGERRHFGGVRVCGE